MKCVMDCTGPVLYYTILYILMRMHDILKINQLGSVQFEFFVELTRKLFL